MKEFDGLSEAELTQLLELVPNQPLLERFEQQLVTGLAEMEEQLHSSGMNMSLQLVDLFSVDEDNLLIEEPSQLVRLQPATGDREVIVAIPTAIELGVGREAFAEILLHHIEKVAGFKVVSSDPVGLEPVDWKLLSSTPSWLEAHLELVQDTMYSTLRLFLPSGENSRGEQPAMTEHNEQQPTIGKAQFTNLTPTSSESEQTTNLDMLLDIPLQITVELGRTRKTVKEVLEITQGSIIELDKLAGEPVDILVNQKLIAVGEVVVIDEQFGIRVTDISSQADRLAKLR